MPLNETFPYAVTFIVAERTDPHSGLAVQRPIGTGVLIAWPSQRFPGASSHYIVTAKHVITRETTTGVRMRMTGGTLEDLPVDQWIEHPDPVADIAISPIFMRRDYDARHIPAELLIGYPDELIADDSEYSDSRDWSPTLGERIYFIGLLDQFASMVKRNVPMVRSGTLGAMYQDDVPVKTDPQTISYYHAHLIDCRPYEGFSGAPCFAQGQPRLRATPPKWLRTKSPTKMLGVIVGHFDLLREAMTNDPSVSVKSPVNSGVGVVATSEQILELLMAKPFEDARSQAEDRWAAREQTGEAEGAATLDSVSPEPSEFDRFEDLTRKLVNTPKQATEQRGES